jgi:gamma-glutamylcyclotransferase (GGCT)/AIG2-like uncharacterized protein YtfP
VTRGPSIASEFALYFAYGSNLLSRRMRARISSARAVGTGWVDGHRLSLGKPGRDGSGKATLIADPDARVWGALYAIDPAHWKKLDGFEPGYTRVALVVTTERGERMRASTYVAPETASDAVAFTWYKRCIVDGAREHDLPAHYVEDLLQLPERPDPNRLGPEPIS